MVFIIEYALKDFGEELKDPKKFQVDSGRWPLQLFALSFYFGPDNLSSYRYLLVDIYIIIFPITGLRDGDCCAPLTITVSIVRGHEWAGRDGWCCIAFPIPGALRIMRRHVRRQQDSRRFLATRAIPSGSHPIATAANIVPQPQHRSWDRTSMPSGRRIKGPDQGQGIIRINIIQTYPNLRWLRYDFFVFFFGGQGGC